MCGICGYLWNSEGREIDSAAFDRMTDSLAHRGPDDRGVFYRRGGETRPNSPGVALGHRRLSILDLSEAGRQPMANPDRTVWVVFNGEIYNFLELKVALQKKGRSFRTGTDTEVLLALYDEYGINFPRYLNGMFAVALWDAQKNCLILTRDRLGKKPLYYRREANRLLFASELNSLFFAPDISREIDPIALDEYLTYQYVPQPRTIYRGIAKLPPAMTAIWTPDGSWRLESYWEVDFNQEDQRRSEAEWSVLLREKMENAVKIRLRSDVPLGAFLSGGIDSSVVVGLMQNFSARPIRTFSIGFKEKEYDETPIARRTAERLGTDHRELFVAPDAEALFPQIARQYGEPFGDSSAIPFWLLCELTRREVTVALSGDGGDELFAGYDRYKAVALGGFIDRAPMFLRRFLAGPVRSLIPASTRQRSLPRRVKRFLEALSMSPEERYLQWIAIFNRSRLDSLRSPFFQSTLADFVREEDSDYDPLDLLTGAMTRSAGRDLVTSISLTDVLTYLPGDILTKVDIASMRHALEVRSPILDYEVAELAFKIPIAQKIVGRKGKSIFRKTFREFLPPELENRPKTGFGVPLDHWFRGPLEKRAREILTDPTNPVAGYFNAAFIDRLLREHSSGVFDHAARIWALLILFEWAKSSL